MNRHTLNFWKKVTRGTSEECWPWTGYTKQSGHGLTWFNGVSIHASRKAWILSRGPIKDGLSVNHKCNNALCCNPDHMYLGTRKDNMRDLWGTNECPRNSPGRPSRLSLAQKHELRRYREAGTSIKRLAEMWHISRTRVFQILSELCVTLGPEKLPEGKRQLARRHLYRSANSNKNSADI